MTFFPRLRSLGGADLDPFIAPQFHAEFDANPVVVYDVGASVELMSPLPLSNEGKARVIGFEPVEISYQALIRMYKGFPDVEVRRLAPADVTGTIAFNIYGAVLTSSSLRTRTSDFWRSKFTTHRVEVDAARLDDIRTALHG